MGRAFSSVRMAFEGIVGVLILFNVCTKTPAPLLRAVETGTYDAAFWETLLPGLVMALIAAALLADAFRLRRRLAALDARIEETSDNENSK